MRLTDLSKSTVALAPKLVLSLKARRETIYSLTMKWVGGGVRNTRSLYDWRRVVVELWRGVLGLFLTPKISLRSPGGAICALSNLHM